jgi:transposase
MSARASFTCSTVPDGLAALRALMCPLGVELIAFEASGGCEGLPAVGPAAAGLPVAIVSPRQVRQFAGATGRLAKAEALDAAVLAHFAETIHRHPRHLPDDLTVRLRELLARRRQLVAMINAEKQRLAKAEDRIA